MLSSAMSSGDNITRSLQEHLHPAAWRNPKAAEQYDLVIVGAGPAGLVAAHEAARLAARVALIERDLLGGTCFNTGCVPSKTLLRASRLYAEMRNADNFGAIVPGEIRVGFASAMERVRRVRARIARESSIIGSSAQSIDMFFGEASFASPDSVVVEDDLLRFKKALIATGARPKIPQIPGLAASGFLTNETLFDLTEQPNRLLVIGGGPTGCELSQAFCRLGSHVTIVQDEPMFLSQEERDAAQILSTAFERDGIEIYLNSEIVGVRLEGASKRVDLLQEDSKITVAADEILVGTGQTPNVERLNLEAARIDYDAEAGIRVNDFLETTNANVFAAGDVCAKRQFVHFEAASSRIVVQNALRSGRKRASALTIPWCTYTDPEIAHVGMYVREAREKNIPVITFTVPMHDVHRAICDGEEEGFVKMHVREGGDRILGATIVSRHAGDMINDISLAIQSGIGLERLGQVIRPYPTQSAAIRMAADAYNARVRNLAKQRPKAL
jgi:pyruvate/2-oxoglutarate dehydrogenase complex dihydrolipoamide dehydrogenase (E3) component